MNIDFCHIFLGERQQACQELPEATDDNGTQAAHYVSDQTLPEDTSVNRGSTWEYDTCYRLSAGKVWTVR